MPVENEQVSRFPFFSTRTIPIFANAKIAGT